ncbi:hypothetical protein [Mycolicibacterium austroafricanum]|uniref:hypothetical protein n=1 Tax=Mycolicibacterium austroafricanum TaxID=39687 RepID=UPI001CA3478C|nr:hypothetical protein [Mycolicibacterium austroafricanum]QZT61817.1 hypothetical protein JN085_23190 [Mycolicibacterium austroafricanum]
MRKAWISAVALLGVILGPAGVAAAQQQNPWVVIEQWESAGYQVNIDRIGNAPIGDCVVTGVRNPQQVVEQVLVVDRDRHHRRHRDLDVVDVVVHQSISVSLDCTG